MAVDQALATISDHLYSGAIVGYSAGIIALCGDYAFGKSARKQRAKNKASLGAVEPATVSSSVLVGAAGSVIDAPHDRLPDDAAPGIEPEAGEGGDRFESITNKLGLLGVVVTALGLVAHTVSLALRSYWLAIHVSAASIATGIFFVSMVASALYLVKARHERKEAAAGEHLPSRIAGSLPSSSVLDRLAARTVTFAFPVWTFAIICGAIWAESAWGRYWGWDPKETWAFISWVVYAGYLHARATAGWKGNKAAYLNLLGAATMLFNFVVVNTVVSGLHSYSGLS